MSNNRLSSVWIVFVNLQSASASLIFIFMSRLSSCLWKMGCFFMSSTIITSPGSSPGSWSPSPWNVIFWPSFIPVTKIIISMHLENTSYEYRRAWNFLFFYLCQYGHQESSSCDLLCVHCSSCNGPWSWTSLPVLGSRCTCSESAGSFPVQSVAPGPEPPFLCRLSIFQLCLFCLHNLQDRSYRS